MSDYIKRDERKYWLKCLVDGILGDDGLCEGCKYVNHGTCYQCRRIGANEIIKIIDADVAPVRYGRWEKNDYLFLDTLYRCSVCGEEFYLENGTPQENQYYYCPNCGAKMDGEKKNCGTCKHHDKGWDEIICDGCTKAHSNWERKDDE